MGNFTNAKRLTYEFLSYCLLYLFYTLVGEIWFLVLYTHENWITYSGIIIIAILLVPLYTYINSRLSLGIGRYLFYIPILPSFIGALLFQPIEDRFFPNLFTQDDLGAGILMMLIALPHWGAMMISFWFAHMIKTRKKVA